MCEPSSDADMDCVSVSCAETVVHTGSVAFAAVAFKLKAPNVTARVRETRRITRLKDNWPMERDDMRNPE